MTRIIIALLACSAALPAHAADTDLVPFAPVKFNATGNDGETHSYVAYWEPVNKDPFAPDWPRRLEVPGAAPIIDIHRTVGGEPIWIILWKQGNWIQ